MNDTLPQDMFWKPFLIEAGQPPLWLFVSPVEWSAYQEASPHNCSHTLKELRIRRTANGTEQWYDQCKNCGRSIGQAKSQNATKCPKNWDDKAEDRWQLICEQRREEMVTNFLQRTADLEGGTEKTYQEYLRSETWRAKRQLVLKRDEYLCQGCLTERATEVHHLSYDDLPNELLFDLISVCGDCHSFIHRKKSVKQAKLERFRKL